jgi:hypothetical protein
MSAIVELQQRIQSTVARIAEFEKAAAQPNSPPSLLANIRGLEKLLASLEYDFERLARSEELDICKYRLLPQAGERPTLTAIARAWTQYQVLFSSVFDAITRGAKKRGRTGKQTLAQTQFAFGYTFSGSIGVVLTLPNRRVDLVTSKALEKTAQTILEMVKAQSEEKLADFVKRLGVPPVAKLAAWADAHVAFEAGAGVEWDISTERTLELLVQVQEFKLLKQTMDKISEPTEVVDSVTGVLRAADMEKHTFKMNLDSGERITGEFDNAITEIHKAALPQRYKAVIRTTTKIQPALEKLDVSRFLIELIEES